MNFFSAPYDSLQANKVAIFTALVTLTLGGLFLDLLRRRARIAAETFANLAIFAANSTLNLGLAQGLQLAALGWVASLMPWRQPENIYAFFACMVGVDFCYYWRHRWEHEIHLLWAEHSVHHSSEEFNFSTSIRLPIVNPFFGWVFFLPLALLGFPAKLILATYIVNLLYQYWVHNGEIERLGWVENILSTPSNHRVHHAKNPEYLDKNYGGILILWDRLFGTYEPERARPVFGIVEPIGTRNPWLINWLPIARFWRKLATQPTVSRRLKVVFGRPGMEL